MWDVEQLTSQSELLHSLDRKKAALKIKITTCTVNRKQSFPEVIQTPTNIIKILYGNNTVDPRIWPASSAASQTPAKHVFTCPKRVGINNKLFMVLWEFDHIK